MNSEPIAALLTSNDFLAEMHHLLWVEPHENRGIWDEGWNCRDHAFLVGFLIAMLGDASAHAIFGKAMFAQGPIGDAPPVGFEQGPHAWTGSNLCGHVDLSLRLSGVRHPDFKFPDWPVYAIAGSQCVPFEGTRFVHTANAQKYESTVSQASHSEGVRTAIYLRQATPIPFTKKVLFTAFDFCNSPLTDRLRTQFGQRPDVYASAVLHLLDFLHAETGSMRELEQLEAWEALTVKYPKPFNRVCEEAGLQ
jgi:hypothetical protein